MSIEIFRRFKFVTKNSNFPNFHEKYMEIGQTILDKLSFASLKISFYYFFHFYFQLEPSEFFQISRIHMIDELEGVKKFET